MGKPRRKEANCLLLNSLNSIRVYGKSFLYSLTDNRFKDCTWSDPKNFPPVTVKEPLVKRRQKHGASYAEQFRILFERSFKVGVV